MEGNGAHEPGRGQTVIMKFDLPKLSAFRAMPLAARGPTATSTCWHCHILEHEEHDMMRPMVVT